MTARRILFVAYGGGHINMLIPVIKALAGDTACEVQVLGLTTASTILAREGIPHIGYRHLLQPGDDEAMALGEALASALDDKAKIDHRETVAYLGLSFMDLAQREGMEKARDLYRQRGRHAFCQLSVMERAIRTLKPDLVVATNSPRSEMAAILSARKLGIPAVCMIDLFASRHLNPWLGEPGYGDRVCVLSQEVKRLLLEYGRRDEEIVVTGNPYFDELADPGLKDRADAMIASRGWAGRKLVLWARQIRAEHQAFYTRTETALLDACSRHPGWHLVIRPHPNDTAKFENLPANCSLSTDADPLSVLLKAVDAVITVTSTVGLQGVLLGKPLITVETPEVEAITQYAPYSRLGLATPVRDLRELEEALARVLGGHVPAPQLPAAGQATQNCVRVIRSLL